LFETVFTDAYSSGRGQVDVVDSVYPNFVESTILQLPAPVKQNTPAADGNRNHTSMAYTANNTLTTFQLDFDNFTGNLKAQGSDSQLAHGTISAHKQFMLTKIVVIILMLMAGTTGYGLRSINMAMLQAQLHK
jgi:hypothetical protein